MLLQSVCAVYGAAFRFYICHVPPGARSPWRRDVTPSFAACLHSKRVARHALLAATIVTRGVETKISVPSIHFLPFFLIVSLFFTFLEFSKCGLWYSSRELGDVSRLSEVMNVGQWPCIFYPAAHVHLMEYRCNVGEEHLIQNKLNAQVLMNEGLH